MIGAFMLIWRLRKNGLPAGWLFGLYLLLAGTERFLVEFVRAKADRLAVGLTLAQLMAIGLVVTGTALMLRWRGTAEVEAGEYLRKGKKEQKDN
jgi:phosphatidylglycerol:prolipoprotein diacylglycerol transferase